MKSTRIAMLDLMMLIKEPGAIMQMIIFPILFTFVFGKAFGPTQTGFRVSPLIVINHDVGTLGSAVVNLLPDDEINVLTESEAGERADRIHRLIIPENFSREIIENPPVDVELHVPEKSSIMQTESIKIAFHRAQIKALATLARMKPETVEQISAPDFMEQWNQLISEDELILTDSIVATRREQPPSGMEHQVPGNIVMFVLMVLLVNSAVLLVSERKDGSFRRLMSAPLTARELITGKLLGRLLPSLIQVILLFLTGMVIFHVNLSGLIPQLIVLSLAYCFCASAMGLAMGMWVDERQHVVAIGVPITLMLAALGGCWWPLEIVSPFMQSLGMALPTGWAMRGFHEIISFGYGIPAIIDNVVFLIALGIFFIWLASRRVRIA